MYIAGFEKTRFIRPLDKGGKKPDKEKGKGKRPDKPPKNFFQRFLKPNQKESDD